MGSQPTPGTRLWVAFQVLGWEGGQRTRKTCPHGHVLGVRRVGEGGGDVFDVKGGVVVACLCGLEEM